MSQPHEISQKQINPDSNSQPQINMQTIHAFIHPYEPKNPEAAIANIASILQTRAYLLEHCQRVSSLALRALQQYPKSDTFHPAVVTEARLAAFAHDIGKFLVDDLFNNSGVHYTDAEREEYRAQHTERGSDVLREKKYPDIAVIAVALHHSLNNQIYIETLLDTPLYMQVALTHIAMADIYDAMLGLGENGGRRYQEGITFTIGDVENEWRKTIDNRLLTSEVTESFYKALHMDSK